MVAQGTYDVAVIDKMWVKQGLATEGVAQDDDLCRRAMFSTGDNVCEKCSSTT